MRRDPARHGAHAGRLLRRALLRGRRRDSDHRLPQSVRVQRHQDDDGRRLAARRCDPGAAPAHPRGRPGERGRRAAGTRRALRLRGRHRRPLPARPPRQGRGRLRQRHRLGGRSRAARGGRRRRGAALLRVRRHLPQPSPRSDGGRERAGHDLRRARPRCRPGHRVRRRRGPDRRGGRHRRHHPGRRPPPPLRPRPPEAPRPGRNARLRREVLPGPARGVRARRRPPRHVEDRPFAHQGEDARDRGAHRRRALRPHLLRRRVPRLRRRALRCLPPAGDGGGVARAAVRHNRGAPGVRVHPRAPHRSPGGGEVRPGRARRRALQRPPRGGRGRRRARPLRRRMGAGARVEHAAGHRGQVRSEDGAAPGRDPGSDGGVAAG